MLLVSEMMDIRKVKPCIKTEGLCKKACMSNDAQVADKPIW